MFRRLNRANLETLKVLNPQGYEDYRAFRRQVANKFRIQRAIDRGQGPVSMDAWPVWGALIARGDELPAELADAVMPEADFEGLW